MAHHIIVVALIATVAWLVVRALYVVEDIAFRRLPVDVPANLPVRLVRTQNGVVRRLTATVVGTLAIATSLMTFAHHRTVGAWLLASAGVVGVMWALPRRRASVMSSPVSNFDHFPQCPPLVRVHAPGSAAPQH